MRIIADLQLHSRFSRAVSKDMTLPNIAAWGERKGIGLVATGDWTHPLWFREIQANLEELGNGLLRLKSDALGGSPFTRSVKVQTSPSPSGPGAKAVTELENARLPAPLSLPLFLLATEVSCIYTQGGRQRRIHTLIWVPTLAAAAKINKEMTSQGCNLMSDGRPIIGLTSIQLAELVLTIEPKALIIPAHCLLPDSMILGADFVPKRIDALQEGNIVLTHTGTLRTVTEVKKRPYKGQVLHIRPWYFRPGLITTPEHPYWAIRTIKKCPSTGDICRPSKAHLALCKKKECLRYEPSWITAEQLRVGDVLIYPRSPVRNPVATVLVDATKKGDDTIAAGGTRGRVILNTIEVSPELGRLIGYYLAEGSTDGDNSFSFCFSQKEQEYVDDVKRLVNEAFGMRHHRIYHREGSQGVEVVFYSKLHARWFAEQCYVEVGRRTASTKRIPSVILQSGHTVQAECLRGWYRGDHGYTTSRTLMNQIKAICLRLGIIPSVIVDTASRHKQRGHHTYRGRDIHANYDTYAISDVSFFEDIFDLKKEFPRAQTKLDRRHGWIDENNVYLPIEEIVASNYEGVVYNLEVEQDHSYVAEFAAVHNCWTPWFSLYGSMSGFDSLDEAFGPYAKHIYAVETGLSSSPAMNWRIKELDSRAIVSFSDAHSGPKLGREATVFDLPELNYENIYRAIRKTQNIQAVGKSEDQTISWSDKSGTQKLRLSESSESSEPRIAYTIEFYPEEGKYHYTGHRQCQVRLSPEETKAKGTTCPVCGRPLTVGVMQRVEDLAVRSEAELQLSVTNYRLSEKGASVQMIRSQAFPNRPPFVMLMPLQEILAESIGSPVTSPKVQLPYNQLTEALGGEFAVLLEAHSSEIAKIAGERVAEAVDKVRRGNIVIDPGYDGLFGVVKIWKEGEEKPLLDASRQQLTMF